MTWHCKSTVLFDLMELYSVTVMYFKCKYFLLLYRTSLSGYSSAFQMGIEVLTALRAPVPLLNWHSFWRITLPNKQKIFLIHFHLVYETYCYQNALIFWSLILEWSSVLWPVSQIFMIFSFRYWSLCLWLVITILSVIPVQMLLDAFLFEHGRVLLSVKFILVSQATEKHKTSWSRLCILKLLCMNITYQVFFLNYFWTH